MKNLLTTTAIALLSTIFISNTQKTLDLSTEASAKVDSLQNAYSKAKEDTTRISTLLAAGEELYLSDPDTAMLLWQQALAAAEKALDKKTTPNDALKKALLKAKADALNNIGYIYRQRGQDPRSIGALSKIAQHRAGDRE